MLQSRIIYPLEAIGRVLRSLRPFRAPLAIVMLALAVLTIPDQTQEVYRVLVADVIDRPIFGFVRIFIPFVALSALSVFTWYCVYALNLTLQDHRTGNPVLLSTERLSILVGLVPLVALAIGMSISLWRIIPQGGPASLRTEAIALGIAISV